MNATVTSFIFGITLAISVGPIAMLIINRSINCGLSSGILTGIGAAFADLSYCIISFAAGSATYALLTAYEHGLQILASLVLIGFGGWMLLNAIRHRKSKLRTEDSSCKGVFVSTYALTMANPLTIVAFTGFAAQSAINGFQTIVVSSIALFAGSLMIQVVLALFGSALKSYVSNPAVIFYLNILSGLSVVAMGLLKLPVLMPILSLV